MKSVTSPRLAALLALALGAAGLARAALYEYRHYPSQITRDFDFSVWATQGSTVKDLQVISAVRDTTPWNNTTNIGVLQSGDNWRRFAEYATDSTPTTVKITANSWTVSKWEIIPSSAASSVTITGNTIEFTLNGPQQVMVRVNDDFNKMIAIFADPVEPTVNPANYTYYFGPNADSTGKFWDYGAAGENQGDTLTLHANESVYIAAGCVLNARITIDGANATVDGRGILRDGLWYKDTAGSHMSMVWVRNSATNVQVKNIKILDTNWFNFIVGGGSAATVSNVKMLSNQGNSDGPHILGATTVDKCFFHVGDDAFVLYNAAATITNCVIGTVTRGYNVSANVQNPVRIINNVHFRMHGGAALGSPGVYYDNTHGLICHFMDGSSTSQVTDFRMIHVDGSQALSCRHLFYAAKTGSTAKTFNLHDVAVPPAPSGKYGIEVLSGGTYPIGNVKLVLRDVYYGTTRIANTSTANIQDQGSPATVVSYMDLADDFEDGNASDWSSMIGSGAGSVAVTTSTSVPDSSFFSGNIVYTRTGTSYEYATLKKTTAAMGQVWNTYGRTGIRFYIKGDSANSTSYTTAHLKIQLREGDNGERWEANIGANLRNTSWTQVSVPFSSMTLLPQGGNGVFDKSAIDQVRFYIPNGAPTAGNVHINIDNVEAY